MPFPFPSASPSASPEETWKAAFAHTEPTDQAFFYATRTV